MRSLLPPPLQHQIKTDWRFIPSTQLGGDAFGYHWLDENHFAIYLLDVCGHGVGAALLSISVVNLLRSETLLQADFDDPSSVLAALNLAFQMEKHNNMFFSIWYGVYNRDKSEILYASGGHPPAILITGASGQEAKTFMLKTPGVVIGALPEPLFKMQVAKFKLIIVCISLAMEFMKLLKELVLCFPYMNLLNCWKKCL